MDWHTAKGFNKQTGGLGTAGTAIPVAGATASKKFACTRTGENLEVNWSVAARLVGGLNGAARRAGLAMNDQGLLHHSEEASLTMGNERQTETVGVSKPRWPGSRQSLDSNDHRIQGEKPRDVLCHEQAPEKTRRACH